MISLLDTISPKASHQEEYERKISVGNSFHALYEILRRPESHSPMFSRLPHQVVNICSYVPSPIN